MQDSSVNDVKLWTDRIWKDSASHSLFANIAHKVVNLWPCIDAFLKILQRFSSAVTALEVESLGQLCKILHTDEHALDIVALHKPITDLLFYSIQFLEDYDCETVGALNRLVSLTCADDLDR